MKIKTILNTVVLSTLTFTAAQTFASSQPITDTAITAYVKTKLAVDSSAPATDITVKTNKGVVNLSGQVNTDEQAEAAVLAAESSPGVKDVDASKLVVKESKHPLDDTLITAKVKGAFVREKLFTNADVAAMTISVETKDGVVYLTGTADNDTQAKNAVKIAKSIHGVKKVDSTVSIGEKSAAK